MLMLQKRQLPVTKFRQNIESSVPNSSSLELLYMGMKSELALWQKQKSKISCPTDQLKQEVLLSCLTDP